MSRVVNDPVLVDAAPTRVDARARHASRLHAVDRVELLVVFCALSLLGAIAYGSNVVHGGYTYDDWANAAASLNAGGLFHAISAFGHVTMYRPGLVVYVPLTFEVFGRHMGFQLAWAAIIGVVVSWTLFGILRTLGLGRLHAVAIGCLVLVFPWFDATRFWATGSQVTLGIALAFAGFWLALIALRRGSLALHAASLALFIVSILTYEIALVLLAAAGIVYVATVGWRAARWRWAADLAVVLGGGIWVLSQTQRESGSTADHLHHLGQMITAGGTLLGRAALPLGPRETTLVLCLLAAVALAGFLAWRRDLGHGEHSDMTKWLLLGAGGLVVAALGWAMFIPAEQYYTPTVYGVTNRVNGLAGVGLVLIVYAALGVVGTLAVRLLSPAPSPRATTAVSIVLALALGVSYKAVVERHSDLWTSASVAQTAALSQIESTFPRLPPNAALYLSGGPNYRTLGVPIFASNWDLNGAVQTEYRDPTLMAMPLITGARLRCDRDGVELVGTGFPTTVTRYGQVFLLDLPTGRSAVPATAAACRRLARSFVAGPLLESTGY